jgi:hypothetical protein
MPQQFLSFREACDYKIEDKQIECEACGLFIAEERFIRSHSDWGTCPYHSHAFVKYRRACYSFEKKKQD